MRVCPRCYELYPDTSGRCTRDGTRLSGGRDPWIGKTIDSRYRLVWKIGSGGMARVYLARHIRIGRMVALKILREKFVRETTQRERFLREAQAVNRIDHPNIVQVTDFGESEEGLLYLVMEFVSGDPLSKVMAYKTMPLEAAFDLAEQVALALHRAHEASVVHRDLKPDNILRHQDEEGRYHYKVVDFGIAKILDEPGITGSQRLFGTPGYIAPECIRTGPIDGRADLYSLGVILYQALSGKLPFEFEYENDLLVKHATEAPIPLRERVPQVPVQVETWIMRCLEKKPDNRYRNAEHFLDALQRTRGGAPISIVPKSIAPARKSVFPATQSYAPHSHGTETWPKPKKPAG